MLYGTLKYIWVWLFFFQAEGSPRCLFRLPHLVHIYVDIRMLDFIVLVKKISGLYSTLGCYHNFQLLNFSNFLIMSPRSQKVCNHLFSQSLFNFWQSCSEWYIHLCSVVSLSISFLLVLWFSKILIDVLQGN
jgi:hypothetical protein